MGLDSVELVMAVEDRFGVRLSDPECTRIGTVADLAALVISRIPGSPTNCLTARTFYDLRSIMVSQCGIERRRVRPDSHIAELFRHRLRPEWRKLRSTNERIPPLEVHDWVVALVYMAAILASAVLFFTGALVESAGPAVTLPLAVGALAVVVGTFILGQRGLCNGLPYGIVTVGDLARCMAPISQSNENPGQWPAKQQQVLDEVRRITASQLGMPIEQVQPGSHFIRDLNLN